MGLIVAFAVAAVTTPFVARLALRLGVIDHPGPLKVHARPVPYLGGVAVLVGLAGPVAVRRPALLAPLALALVLGLTDDIADLSPAVRLACELAVGLCVAFVVPTRGPLGAATTVAMVLVLLNAVNLLDGLDGLASGVGVVSAIGFAVVLHGESRLVALALVGALGGFLLWNRPPAKIYLGDAGSYLVGTTLALLLATSFGAGQPAALACGSMLFVAVPVGDTAVAIVRRMRAGNPLLQGDRSHIYDQLVTRGWAQPVAVSACIGAQIALVVMGAGITTISGPSAAAATVGVVILVGGATLLVFTSPHRRHGQAGSDV